MHNPVGEVLAGVVMLLIAIAVASADSSGVISLFLVKVVWVFSVGIGMVLLIVGVVIGLDRVSHRKRKPNWKRGMK